MADLYLALSLFLMLTEEEKEFILSRLSLIASGQSENDAADLSAYQTTE